MTRQTLRQKLEPHRILAFTLGGFVFIRLVLLISLPYEGLLGYGDLRTYFHLASIPGWPYFQYWSEYPPLFPFLAELVYQLANANEYIFAYALMLLFLASDLVNLILFYRIAPRGPARHWQTGLLALLLCALPYTWWFFDSLVVFFVLLSLFFLQRGKALGSGLSIGLGAIFKLFPLLMLGLAVKKLAPRKIAYITAIATALVVFTYGALWLLSPDFTAASLKSQPSKGSWQTLWALVDGNLRTGSFGPLAERLQPESASVPVNNPPRLSPWLTLPFFVALGLWRFLKTKTLLTFTQQAALAGLIWCLFFLWLPGWSPQWVYYLLPFIILALPLPRAALFGATLIFTNLLEWPLLLSRGLFWALPLTIILRALVLLLLAQAFDKQLNYAPATSA